VPGPGHIEVVQSGVCLQVVIMIIRIVRAGRQAGFCLLRPLDRGAGFWELSNFRGKASNVSFRSKLVVSFLAVVIICGVVTTIAGVHLIGKGIVNQAQDQVRSDLNSARQIYREEIDKIRDVVRFTSLRFFIKDALAENDLETLKEHLGQIKQAERLDVLTLTDASGKVMVRARNPAVFGDDVSGDALVRRVLADKSVVAGTMLAAREELMKEGEDLADRAHIQFVPTPRAKPSGQNEQTSGMMLRAAAPVFSRGGELAAILYGGNLLNRDYTIVDEVKETLYGVTRYKGKDIGTATIFQGDVRISTNVCREDGSRAIGTRLSEEVYERVLTEGLPWIDRAFVVNAWYRTAYEPIRDVESKIIGVLYVGILEEKFADMQKKTMATFVGITVAGMVIALIVCYFLAGGILRPIERLVCASERWGGGNLDYQVDISGQDEIARLGETFNRMACSLKERDLELKEYTSQQIMKSEKLATLGQLAAGVAHEVNNPLGAILMYTHLALEDLEATDEVRSNLQKSIKEASRCRDIVKALLDFARQSEPRVEESDVNETLRQTLEIVENQSLFQNIKIRTVLCSSPPKVAMDVGQIQQVFTNIMLNAGEAMEGRGELTITTGVSADNRYIEVTFCDTGPGIPFGSDEQIFEPFFTTKAVGRGTGLGLSISHGIIARHKGSIEVRSERGEGATFIVKLPLSRKED